MMDRERDVREADVAEERNPVRRGMIFNRETPVREREAVIEARAVGVREASKVHFGPIWVGFLGGMTALLVLGAMATALGLAALPDTAPVAAINPTTTAIVAGLVGIVSLLLGGYLCGYLLNEAQVRFGALHGFMVGCLTIVGLVLLSTMGVTGLASAILGRFNLAAALPTNITGAEAAQAVASGAGWFVLLAALLLTASAIGGWVGTAQVRKEMHEGLRTRNVA